MYFINNGRLPTAFPSLFMSNSGDHLAVIVCFSFIAPPLLDGELPKPLTPTLGFAVALHRDKYSRYEGTVNLYVRHFQVHATSPSQLPPV